MIYDFCRVGMRVTVPYNPAYPESDRIAVITWMGIYERGDTRVRTLQGLWYQTYRLGDLRPAPVPTRGELFDVDDIVTVTAEGMSGPCRVIDHDFTPYGMVYKVRAEQEPHRLAEVMDGVMVRVATAAPRGMLGIDPGEVRTVSGTTYLPAPRRLRIKR